ncbi:hypothetical protein VQ056_12300 [Paenibacillus sp. JTLBN-2024]
MAVAAPQSSLVPAGEGRGAVLPEGLIEELIQKAKTETGYARVGALSIHPDRKKFARWRSGHGCEKDAPEIGELRC